MSVNIRIHRKVKSVTNKLGRKADWIKIGKTLKSISFIPLLFSLIVFSITYSSDQTHNSVRRIVSLNPRTTTAKVIVISRGKATYQFLLNRKSFIGRSVHGFTGEIGQTACVEYSFDKPDVNLLCDDMEFVNPFKDSFLTSVMLFGISLLWISLPLIWMFIFKDKKVVAELTSSGNSYR